MSGQPCCEPSSSGAGGGSGFAALTCQSGLACTGNGSAQTCAACGDAGQPCCAMRTCNNSLTCANMMGAGQVCQTPGAGGSSGRGGGNGRGGTAGAGGAATP